MSIVTIQPNSVQMYGVFDGPESDLQVLLTNVTSIGAAQCDNVWGGVIGAAPPQCNTTMTVDWISIVTKGTTSPTQARVWEKSDSNYALAPINSTGLDVIMGLLKADPHKQGTVPYSWLGQIQLDSYGGQVNAKTATETAFPHREVSFHVEYYVQWAAYDNATATVQDVDSALEWVAKWRKKMAPYWTTQSYRNYPNKEIVDYMQAYYGPNVARLQQIKAAYDPQNMFQFEQSITLP